MINPVGRHVERLRQAIHTHPQVFQGLFQDFAGMHGRQFAAHRSLTVVVGDFDVIGTTLFPGKADSVLTVDPRPAGKGKTLRYAIRDNMDN